MQKMIVISLTKMPARSSYFPKDTALFEFHIKNTMRLKYEVDDYLFSISGNVILADFRSVRILAEKINKKRKEADTNAIPIRPGHLNAMGLIDEIYHFLLRLYEETINPGVFERAHSHLVSNLGEKECARMLNSFVLEFSPLLVFKNILSVETYLGNSTGNRKNSLIALEEFILLHFANFNPSFVPYKELFDDNNLATSTEYKNALTQLENFFANEKVFGPEGQTVFDLLRAPILAHPDSIEDQLGFIKTKWGLLLSDSITKRLLSSKDLFAEDGWLFQKGGFTKGDVPVPQYTPSQSGQSVDFGYPEHERFTPDIEWMPRVVLLAKNTYVWLAQLSKKYGISINRLDQIPDQELDQIAKWNFTGLWLIGVWERSNASRSIKQMTGNPEAVPSAYSLFDYEIAEDLGGEGAFSVLAHKAWARGIRLAGDMVPNHVGIYSRWMIDHPEYFIQSDACPYPNYRFTGPNLSEDSRVQLRIEDGYWSRSDAAVVFQRIDSATGEVRYIYHGNDGTNMPWNDTAQLDLLKVDVREALMERIFHVARKFSVIRFDAAMTLAKRHYQRLWFPQPGTGGAIPTRSDYSMTREAFDAAIPNEFWRDVVDRINRDLPHTLLLAEAFWLMEGYFVRTLGMHRVYNSAFMHMLMKEENEKYRMLIRNTLEFNPEILKRYVNFMSNPDEETAVAQFGKGDKYFGATILMVTLPGLPMFAHGQIEGLTEKYGMEYKRAYYQETPDEYLMRRHEQEIFPLMKKRYLFSQVEFFEFFDFHDARGYVNQNVFAYSNRSGLEAALIVYHNKYEECRGSIMWTVPKRRSTGRNETVTSVTLSQALNIRSDEGVYYVFRDQAANLEYIRSGKEIAERGLYVELRAFQYHVFADFREVVDDSGVYWQLTEVLHGVGVPDINLAVERLRKKPVTDAFERFLDSLFMELSEFTIPSDQHSISSNQFREIRSAHTRFLSAFADFNKESVDVISLQSKLMTDIISFQIVRTYLDAEERKHDIHVKYDPDVEDTAQRCFAAAYSACMRLFDGEPSSLFPTGPRISPIDLADALLDVLARRYPHTDIPTSLVHTFELLLKGKRFLRDLHMRNVGDVIVRVLQNEDAREFLRVNHHEGVWYFNKERYEHLVRWAVSAAFVLNTPADSLWMAGPRWKGEMWSLYAYAKDVSAQAGYRIDRLDDLLTENRFSS